MTRNSLAALACVAVCLSCAETPRSQQLAAKDYYTPAALETKQGVAPRAMRTLKVVAYADDDYRASVLHWKERIEAQLAHASEATGPALGVTFRLVDVRPWSHSLRGTSLVPALQALVRQEPGDGVDLVLGYVTSLPSLEVTQDELGRAELLGKHAVLRGIESAAEGDAIRKNFTALYESEQESLYRDRKLHKETAIFLHEWAHTLGAPHEREVSRLLSPTYSLRISAFGPEALALLEVSLEAQRAGASEKERAAAVLAELEKVPAAWIPDDWKAQTAWLGKSASGTAVATAPADTPLSKDEVARAERVVQLSKASMYGEAEAQLAPLLERHPRHPWLTALGCQVQVLADPSSARAAEQCRAAAAVATDAWPASALARTQLAAKDAPAARQTLLDLPPALLAASPEETIAAVAGLAAQLSLVSLAAEVAARAPAQKQAKEAAAWSARARRTRGLKPGLPPVGVEEGAYLDEFRALQAAMEKGALADAKKRIAALGAKYAQQPGPLVLECELKLRQSDVAGATRACTAAIARWDEAAYAHYLLGVIAEGTRDARGATSAFTRTIALDPTNEDAWRRLATIYRAARDDMALDALKGRFSAQFGRPL